MTKVLVVDDEANMLHMLRSHLMRHGFDVICAGDGSSALQILQTEQPDVVFCDVRMPGMDGLEVLRNVIADKVPVRVVMMSAFATVDLAVEAMRLGAYDFITKPFKLDEILCALARIREVQRLERENARLRLAVMKADKSSPFARIVGQSREMRAAIDVAERVAIHDTSVLIQGESGTGKELVAQGIHLASTRSASPFIAVNCGAIPAGLMESEFFGHAKGAFTGAEKEREGLFAAAHGGTLFLDEIAELPPGMQVKLLRVLQEKEFRPIGKNTTQKTDVRILAATAHPLEAEVEEGRFRQDLYFRLNVVCITLPPLRSRTGDIRLLAHYFFKSLSARLGRSKPRIDQEFMSRLERYHWPGNVRELENIIEFCCIYAQNDKVVLESLPEHILNQETSGEQDILNTQSLKTGKERLEKYLIGKALQQCDGNKKRSAEVLEISYPSLLQKIRQYDLE